jgi:hypothetical protein
MHGCCNQVEIVQHRKVIEIDIYAFCVTIVYCKNCGSVKKTTNVRHIRDGNKTEH